MEGGIRNDAEWWAAAQTARSRRGRGRNRRFRAGRSAPPCSGYAGVGALIGAVVAGVVAYSIFTAIIAAIVKGVDGLGEARLVLAERGLVSGAAQYEAWLTAWVPCLRVHPRRDAHLLLKASVGIRQALEPTFKSGNPSRAMREHRRCPLQCLE